MMMTGPTLHELTSGATLHQIEAAALALGCNPFALLLAALRPSSHDQRVGRQSETRSHLT